MKFCRKAILFLAVSASSAAVAQEWPSRPIRAVIPFTAGSGSDIVGRTVLEQISKQIGQPIIVENRVGAGGTIGTAVVAKADPDGYTLLFESSAHTSTPLVYKNLTYTPSDFIPIASVASLPQVLIISPSKNITSVGALAEAAKANPGKMSYASGGIASATHLSVERFRLSAGFEAVHVPFRGGPEAITEVMTGRVDFYFVPVLPALGFIRDGRLLALAVSAKQRASLLPDVPTTTEAGFKDSDYNFWVGLLAPAKTPQPIVERLHAEVEKAVKTPEVAAKLKGYGADPMLQTAAEFRQQIKDELAANEKLVKAIGITAQ
jgi:tripartite-type tricarboxylate transporter receptor subunit TctC